LASIQKGAYRFPILKKQKGIVHLFIEKGTHFLSQNLMRQKLSFEVLERILNKDKYRNTSLKLP